jgi:hypothetical protein
VSISAKLRSPSQMMAHAHSTNSNDLLWAFRTSRHGPHRKHNLSIFYNACLLIHCLAIDVQLLRALNPAGTCPANRRPAVGPHITILILFLGCKCGFGRYLRCFGDTCCIQLEVSAIQDVYICIYLYMFNIITRRVLSSEI